MDSGSECMLDGVSMAIARSRIVLGVVTGAWDVAFRAVKPQKVKNMVHLPPMATQPLANTNAASTWHHRTITAPPSVHDNNNRR